MPSTNPHASGLEYLALWLCFVDALKDLGDHEPCALGQEGRGKGETVAHEADLQPGLTFHQAAVAWLNGAPARVSLADCCAETGFSPEAVRQFAACEVGVRLNPRGLLPEQGPYRPLRPDRVAHLSSSVVALCTGRSWGGCTADQMRKLRELRQR